MLRQLRITLSCSSVTLVSLLKGYQSLFTTGLLILNQPEINDLSETEATLEVT